MAANMAACPAWVQPESVGLAWADPESADPESVGRPGAPAVSQTNHTVAAANAAAMTGTGTTPVSVVQTGLGTMASMTAAMTRCSAAPTRCRAPRERASPWAHQSVHHVRSTSSPTNFTGV